MPAKKALYIQKYLNESEKNKKTLREVLLDTVGNTNPNLYQQPSAETVDRINEFIDTLIDFENHALAYVVNDKQTELLLDKMLVLQEQLQLKAIRPREAKKDKDWIMFVPEIIDENTPVEIAAVFVYRFGLIKDRASDNSPNHSVGNLGLVSEHSLADGTESLTAETFLETKAKFIVANFFRPHTVANPNYDHAAKPPSRDSIKYFTDPAHSDTTIFAPILTNLLQDKFPEIPVLIMHGMGARFGEEYQVLIGNCFGKLRDDGWRSFANMLAISFGIEDYFTSEEKEAANQPSAVVKVASELPNSVLKGDKIVPMSSDIGDTNGALRQGNGVISSNVTGHIGLFAEDIYADRIKKRYKCSDRMIHVETTGFVRTNKHERHENRDKFIEVIKRALYWYERYDAAIHDPYKLADRFIAVATNMKMYGKLFGRTFRNRYKKRQADIYAADTEEYLRVFSRRKQLPPQNANTEEVVNEPSDMEIEESIVDLVEKDYETDDDINFVIPLSFLSLDTKKSLEDDRPRVKRARLLI